MVLSVTTIDDLFGARLAVIVPDAVTSAVAAAARAHFTDYARYALYDRGSYDVIERVDVPELFAVLVGIAAKHTTRTLAVAEARVVRLRAGDYILAHHDRVYTGHPLELVLDLSPASVPGAELHYRRRGQVYFRIPCVPGVLAIVERGPTVTCNHTYVSKLSPDAVVIRLMVLFRDA